MTNDTLGIPLLIMVLGLLAKAVWDLVAQRRNGRNGRPDAQIAAMNGQITRLEADVLRLRDGVHDLSNIVAALQAHEESRRMGHE